MSSTIDVVLQPRDLEVLCGLLESRFMALRHIAAIYFNGHAEMAKKRMQRLRANGYAIQHRRALQQPALITLTKKGLTTIQEYGLLQRYPQVQWSALEKRLQVSTSTLNHELEVLDLRAALTASLNNTSAKVQDFQTWPALYQFTVARRNNDGIQRELVKPDGYFHIVEEKDRRKFDYTFFLEVDRSTETQDILAAKGACYAAYYRAGSYCEWLGHTSRRFRQYPFCVLMVLKNTERRNNTAERLLQLNPPVHRQIWLTTWKEVMTNPLGAIWMQPKAYLDVTRGTAFDPYSSRQAREYRGHQQRDELIENEVKKRMLVVSWLRSETN